MSSVESCLSAGTRTLRLPLPPTSVVIDSDGRKKADGEMEVTQDISMGMFLLKLRQHPDERVRLRFKNIEAEAPSTQQELTYA